MSEPTEDKKIEKTAVEPTGKGTGGKGNAGKDTVNRETAEKDTVNRETTEKDTIIFQANRKYRTIAIYAILVLLAAAVIFRLFFAWTDVVNGIGAAINMVMPFIIGFLVAFFLNPLARFLDQKVLRRVIKKKKRSETIAIAISFIVFLACIILLFRYIIPQIYESVRDLIVNKIPLWAETLSNTLTKFSEQHPGMISEGTVTSLDDMLNAFLSSDAITDMSDGIMPQIMVFSKSLLSGLLNFIVALVASLYMLSDSRIINRGMRRLVCAIFEKDVADAINTSIHESVEIFSAFVWGKSVDSLIIGILSFILMNILHLPYALLLSAVVGVTNMIPYFGPFIGAVPGTLILLLNAPLQALIYLIMIVCLQQFDGLVLGPKILGDFVGLRPLWILFAITVGGVIGGVLGMFVGVPILAVFQNLLSKWIQYRLDKKGITDAGELKEDEDPPILPTIMAKKK